jgi:hypothetical protein
VYTYFKFYVPPVEYHCSTALASAQKYPSAFPEKFPHLPLIKPVSLQEVPFIIRKEVIDLK